MNLKRHIRWVPLYNIDPKTGARVEIFYADRALAASFGWPTLPAVMPHTAIPDAHAALKGLRRLLMPDDRAARPCGFFAPELSIIVHDFTHQVLDQLLSHPAVLLAS